MSGSMRLDSSRFGESPKPAELDPWLLWPAVALHVFVGLFLVWTWRDARRNRATR